MKAVRSRLFIFLAALAGVAPPAPARGDSPPAEATEVRTAAALDGLTSPFLRERREAARALAALLPDSRAAMLEAWRTGDEPLRVELADVLATDGGVDAMVLLIDAWQHGPAGLFVEVQKALLKNPDATRAGLAAVRARVADPAKVARQLNAIAELLLRDAIEKLFLSRKSKSGGTGVYKGQYDVLLPNRERALEICYHIMRDRAMYQPGTPALGTYRYLTPKRQVLEAWEIREMALSAIADLARPTDRELILKLDKYMRELAEKPDSDAWTDVIGDPEKDALYNDLLVTLYRLRPTIYKDAFEERLRERVREFNQRPLISTQHEIISMRLRAGRYEEAIKGYLEILGDSPSKASDHYNMACAYALWSLEPGRMDPASLKRLALNQLSLAVDAQWTDVGWMEQDRDLDPIRNTLEYRGIVERAKRTVAGDVGLPAPAGPRRGRR
jgi:hypothetical protein